MQRAEAVFQSAWAARGSAAPTPLRIKVIDDAAARHEAQRLFYAGQYGRVAEMLAEVGTRENLTPAEMKMLELALKRAAVRLRANPNTALDRPGGTVFVIRSLVGAGPASECLYVMRHEP